MQWTHDELMAEVVTPSLERMFGPDELAQLEVELSQDTVPSQSTFPGARSGEPDGWWNLVVRVGEDRHQNHVVQGDAMADWTAEQVAERLRSDLQDFIAESRFAWGELRPT